MGLLLAVSEDHIGKRNASNFPYLFPSYRFMRKWVVPFRQLFSFKIGALATVCHDKRRKASNKTYHSCLGGCLNCSIIAARSNQNNIQRLHHPSPTGCSSIKKIVKSEKSALQKKQRGKNVLTKSPEASFSKDPEKEKTTPFSGGLFLKMSDVQSFEEL